MVYNSFCNFGDGFVNCGGDDVPIGFDSQISYGKTLRVDYNILPTCRIDYSPEYYEVGFYIQRTAKFE